MTHEWFTDVRSPVRIPLCHLWCARTVLKAHYSVSESYVVCCDDSLVVQKYALASIPAWCCGKKMAESSNTTWSYKRVCLFCCFGLGTVWRMSILVDFRNRVLVLLFHAIKLWAFCDQMWSFLIHKLFVHQVPTLLTIKILIRRHKLNQYVWQVGCTIAYVPDSNLETLNTEINYFSGNNKFKLSYFRTLNTQKSISFQETINSNCQTLIFTYPFRKKYRRHVYSPSMRTIRKQCAVRVPSIPTYESFFSMDLRQL